MEDEIVEMLHRNHHIDRNRVTESVRKGRLDRFNALYYLTLKNEKSQHKNTTN